MWVRPVAAAGHLDGAVDDLRPGVAEVDRVERSGQLGDQHLREARDRIEVAEAVADVDELVDLRVDGAR